MIQNNPFIENLENAVQLVQQSQEQHDIAKRLVIDGNVDNIRDDLAMIMQDAQMEMTYWMAKALNVSDSPHPNHTATLLECEVHVANMLQVIVEASTAMKTLMAKKLNELKGIENNR